MNIQKAKEQIINTVRAYLEKDSRGRYLIPQHKQRPIFLMGPPGVGKTEIMTQTASELGIGLLSYSMTHHTRQSALGLPMIKQKEYGGEQYDASEYTMSEIIASVYDMMRTSGVTTGILFLDEINCVSETLTPIMLQFLQYKVFGGHRLPAGWIVVTAGNTPEYNNSVREFDIVTWDRLKRIDIEPDLKAWKQYAHTSGVHGAIMTYLDIKPQNFYKIETTASGKSFVTARGWDDLGHVLEVYERLDIEADGDLIKQYIQNPSIAEDFAVYYKLYNKYKSDYRVGDILSGSASEEISGRASAAGFDERYSLLGLLLTSVGRESLEQLDRSDDLMKLKAVLAEAKQSTDPSATITEQIKKLDAEREKLTAANALSTAKDDSMCYIREQLTAFISSGSFDGMKQHFSSEVSALRDGITEVRDHMTNMLRFCEQVFGSGQELLILVTELAADPTTARFISAYGCDEYYRHDKELMLYERRIEIINELNKLSELETEE